MAVVLVLVGARLDGEVEVRACDSRQEEVDHGPQLSQGVLQRAADQQDPLLTAIRISNYIKPTKHSLFSSFE